ncbi:hypothetical protein BKA64DRAFT_639165 [Cadophora sp. MPI-SDFR-AT-0126]|nr:hypothetical protein BKA64DRAFT_639165 [Leotiomycetes sp. MPI-SDFR-AT-0126]
MDRIVDRARYKDAEERYDIYQAGDTIIDDLEAQRISFPEVPSNRIQSSYGLFPSSPSGYSQSSTVGKCLLYYIRKCTGSPVDFRYTLEEYVDLEQELVYAEVQALQRILFQEYVGGDPGE